MKNYAINSVICPIYKCVVNMNWSRVLMPNVKRECGIINVADYIKNMKKKNT